MDRARHGLRGRWRGHRGRRLRHGRLLIRRLGSGLRHGRRGRRSGRVMLRLWRGSLRHGGGLLRLLIYRLLRLWRIALRGLLLVLLCRLLAHGSALLRLGHSRKLAAQDGPGLARCRHAALLGIERQIKLQAWLATAVLRVLAGVESSGQLLE